MFTLLPQLTSIILAFAPVFWKRTWKNAEVLPWGAILAPGKRRITSAVTAAAAPPDPSPVGSVPPDSASPRPNLR